MIANPSSLKRTTVVLDCDIGSTIPTLMRICHSSDMLAALRQAFSSIIIYKANFIFAIVAFSERCFKNETRYLFRR